MRIAIHFYFFFHFEIDDCYKNSIMCLNNERGKSNYKGSCFVCQWHAGFELWGVVDGLDTDCLLWCVWVALCHFTNWSCLQNVWCGRSEVREKEMDSLLRGRDRHHFHRGYEWIRLNTGGRPGNGETNNRQM